MPDILGILMWIRENAVQADADTGSTPSMLKESVIERKLRCEL